MIWTLDVGPAIELKARISTIALCTGLTVYLECVLALALLTERQLRVPAATAMIPVVIAQFWTIRRPARQFVQGRLGQSIRVHLCLALVVLALLALGTAPGTSRIAALILEVGVIGGPSWPALRALRIATHMRRTARVIADARVIEACLSFEPWQWMAVRLRALGGEPVRWAAPFATAAVTMAVTAGSLALVLQAVGVESFGTPVAQVSTLVAIWVFYYTLRHTKPRAAALRQHDVRPPVLVLRQFDDDMLGSGWLRPATFEQHIVNDLHRMGPAISIGEPGQRLQPLGAAREYLAGGDWKKAVGQLIDVAGLVIIVLGSSRSLVWELEEAFARGRKARLMIIAPAHPKRTDIERRWAAFVEATADIFCGELPLTLPEGRLLALFFASDDVVMVVSGAPVRKRSFALAQSLPEYRLWLRLRECLGLEDTTSIRALEAFFERKFPFVTLRGLGSQRRE